MRLNVHAAPQGLIKLADKFYLAKTP